MEACTHRKGKLCHCIHTFWSLGSLQTCHSARMFCWTQNRVQLKPFALCMTSAKLIPSLEFLDHLLSTIRISPPVFFPWVALPHRVTSTTSQLAGQWRWCQVAEIGCYRHIHNGPGLTYSTIDCKNDTHDVLSTEHVQRANALDPTLCRLYFGKVIKELGPGGRPNRFFNSANFPLDVSRYRKLLEVAGEGNSVYPSVEDIAYGMGEMLGRLHSRVGYDGYDVEFVMGGASFIGVAMYIIDFN